MEIRKLKRTDWKDILKLKKQSESKIVIKYDTEYRLKDEKEYIDETLKKGIIIGFFQDSELIGTGGIAIFKDYGYGVIRQMYVNPKYRRKGVGNKIINYLEDYAKKLKIKNIRLDVFYRNPAKNFYNKQGYKIKAYRMEKKIK
jgi:GNAT superfamily N-acetyltransferase